MEELVSRLTILLNVKYHILVCTNLAHPMDPLVWRLLKANGWILYHDVFDCPRRFGFGFGILFFVTFMPIVANS